MVRTRPLIPVLVLAIVLVTTPASAVYKICIDPGHGGSDPGAVGCGMEEAANTLDVGLRLKDLMNGDPDLTPIMTRTSDVSVSLGGRVAYANDNGAHRFASIHNNAFNGSATGIETFCYSNGSAVSFDQRNRIQDAMTSTWPGLTDRGGKTAGFYVIKYTNMPATLSELAFIDNCSIDAPYLSNPTQRQAAAVAHHQAIRLSLGLTGANPNPDPDPDPDPDPGPNPGGTGVLRGVIFEDVGVGSDDMSIRVPGAFVEAAGGGDVGDDVADVPDADWLIALAPGTYTVTAAAAGYYENTRVCAVTAGQTTWCSIGLFEKVDEPPAPSTGVLRGVVFADQGVGDQDMSIRLSGAMITVQGEDDSVDMATAASPDAAWQFSLPEGTWTVKASHPGYWMNTRVCDVVAGAEAWCSLGLFSVEEDPPLDPPIPSEGPKGTLLGTIFEEQGQGTLDMSIRLHGASVKAIGAVGSLTAETDGAWGLYDMELPPGVYEVTAALTGYWPNTRLCAVAEGTETWCSLGLWPEDEKPPADPTPGYGDGPPEDPGGEDPPPEFDPGEFGAEAPPTEEPGQGFEPIPDQPAGEPGDAMIVEGCASSRESSGGAVVLILLALAGILALRRRRGAALLALAMLLAPAVRAGEGDGLQVRDLRAVTDGGDHEQPVWSPDGARLAFAAARFSRLAVVAAEGGPTRTLVEGTSVGYAPVWSPDGAAVEHRRPGQRSSAVPQAAVTLDGGRAAAPVHRHAGTWVLVRDDQIHLRTGTTERRLSPEGDRYCCATRSADGGAVAFMGLATGIHVHDVASGQTVPLGSGAHARFSMDGSRLVFDRCVDDGDVLVGCTLWMADLTGATPVLHEIQGAHPIARHPALSPDGTRIAYDADGRIWVGRLE